MMLSPDVPSLAPSYQAEAEDDATLVEHQLALARAWLAAGGAMTQVRRVTVLRPVVSARVPGYDVAVPE